MQIFNFEEQFTDSNRTANQEKAEAILHQLFPGQEIIWNSTDANDKGIDLTCGENRIDIKYRNVDTGHSDVALELWSDKDHGKVGWALDDTKQSDFIVWVYLDSGRHEILPFPLLREAFKKHLDDWLIYRTEVQANARNGRFYNSEVVFVPVRAIKRGIQGLGNG